MKTKRLLSLLLSLALLTGLFTATALADGTQEQLYRVYTDDNGTIEDTENSFFPSAGGSQGLVLGISDGSDGYTVITDSSGYTVTYRSTSGVQIEGVLSWNADEALWRWDSGDQLPGSEAVITATKDGVTYALPVTVSAAVVGVYTSSEANVAAPGESFVVCDNGTFKVEQSVKSVYLKTGYNDISLVVDGTHPVSSDNGNVSCSLGENGVLTVTNSTDAPQCASIGFFVKEGARDPSRWEYTIQFGEPQQGGDQGDGQDGGQGSALQLASASRDMTSADYISDLPGLTASFTHQGQTYYMGSSLSTRHLPGGGAMYFPMIKGEHRNKMWDIAFWTKQGENYFLVTPEKAVELAGCFGSLSLRVYALRGENAATPEKYPAIYSGESTGYPCAVTLALGLENRATWVFVATGELGDRTLTAACQEKWEPVVAQRFVPDAESEKSAVQQINEYLASFSADESVNLTIALPAGEHSGYIAVPTDREGLGVVIVEGARGRNGELLTTLKGGLYSEAVSIHADGIQFVGAGKEQTGSGVAKGGSTQYRNCAIYGDRRSDGGAGTGGAVDCTFTGYDIALYSRDCSRCTFRDNRTALYIDVPVGDLNGEIDSNTFESNGVAVRFADIGYRYMSDFTFYQNCFLENITDIANDTGKYAFIPGNFFGKWEGNKLEPCTCKVDANVLYYPQAANASFTPDDDYGYAYIYDTDWYDADTLVIWDNFAASWPIPAAYCSGSFTIMNADGAALGSWRFGK